MVERCSVAEVSSYTGIPQVTAVENLSRIWKQVQGSGAALELPRGWRAPQATECDMVHEDRNPEVD